MDRLSDGGMRKICASSVLAHDMEAQAILNGQRGKIATFENGWWSAACDALGRAYGTLPIAADPGTNSYAPGLGERLAHGAKLTAGDSGATGCDLLLDNGGTGLAFVANPGAPDTLACFHEQIGAPLCSHFIDPIVTAFQGLDWVVLWQALQSTSWIKAIWDKAQARELLAFRVPGVTHLPMAAPDRAYDRSPLDARACAPVVSFVGGQNSTYFTGGASVPTSALLPAMVSSALRAGAASSGWKPNGSFLDAYYHHYGFANPPGAADDLGAITEKARAYFAAKLHFNASLTIANRDRWIIFLKRALGDRFRLIGSGWKESYGLPSEPPLPGRDDYFRHFREVAINLNLVSGNAESGLNMRHFEITASGGFMLCYDQPEIHELFAPGRECAVFRDECDLLEKIDYYLARPDERAEIAAAGQRRTLSQHLYRHRLRSLLRIVEPADLPVRYSSSSWMEDLPKIVPRPRVIVDGGANVGQTARALRKLFPAAKIVSFEPVTHCFEALEAAAREIGVCAVRAALSDRDGTAQINLTASPECHSLLGYEEGNPCDRFTWEVGTEEVDTVRLDTWVERSEIEIDAIDVIKLDLQGAELMALRGAPRVLERARVVIAEVSHVPLYDGSPLLPDIDDFMGSSGFHRAAIYPSDQPHHWGEAMYVRQTSEASHVPPPAPRSDHTPARA